MQAPQVIAKPNRLIQWDLIDFMRRKIDFRIPPPGKRQNKSRAPKKAP
jgi:hypothetical protein